MKRYISFAKYVRKLHTDNHIAAYSAQAAFFVLVSAVPLVVFVIVLAGALVPFDTMSVADMLSKVFSADVSSRLEGIAEEIVSSSTVPLASVTMLFVVWAATNGIRSIAHGLGNIFGSAESYNIIQLTVRSVIYAVVMFAVGILSVAVLVFAQPAEAAATAVMAESAKVILVVLNLRNVIFFFAFTLLFAIAYKGLAKSTLKFRQQLPGAAVAAAGWIVYSFGFSLYIKYFSRYSVLYGSFGAVMLFMLWLYMCMNILLWGALINRLLYGEKCD